MHDGLYIGVDSSTTSSKAIAWDAAGTVVADAREPLRTASPQPGFAEQDAEEWWRSTRRAIRRCARDAGARRIAGVGVTVQRETFAVIDDSGRPVRPAILWYDARAAALLPGLGRRIGARRYHAATGKQLDVTSAVAKLQWLAQNEPESLSGAPRFADVLAYLALQLTGNLATTVAGADTTGLIHLEQRQWHGPHVRAAGLSPAQLPALVEAGSPLGVVRPAAARVTGLHAGIPVLAGGGDGHCFALGAGLLRGGVATLTLGTSAVLGVPVPSPIIGEEFRTLISCAPGEYLLESVIQCGSATVTWLHDTFIPGTWSRADATGTDRDCADIPAGSDGLIVLPHWRGVRVPHNDPRARGVVVGWTDRHTAAHFHRAIMEGIALEAAALLERICGKYDLRVTRLVVGGGGAVSDTWCQILADVFALPCLRAATVETASLGAAMLAMSHCAGRSLGSVARGIDAAEQVFRPRKPVTRIYAGLRELHAKLYKGNRDVCHALSEMETLRGSAAPKVAGKKG